ncbi:uncharacterized protein [Littorina saxatilis]|uniref:Uncharacterized protein n=1 Tax=Littorina saxatilis TaxID=31220 RepID=A0AAN9BLW3_9CAEN
MADPKTTQQKAKEAEARAQGKGDNQATTVDLSAYLEPHDGGAGVKSFAINPHERNTAEHPDHESTFTMPVLVRRVNSEELLPSPFKSTAGMICTSYLCMLCCCCCAAFAVKRAWKAKTKRNAGVYTSAIHEAKRSCYWMKLSLAFGLVLWIIGTVLVILTLTGVIGKYKK